MLFLLKTLLIISIFLFFIITIRMEIKLKNIKYTSEKIKGKNIDPNFIITIKIFTAEKVPIAKFKINENKIKKINKKLKIKEKIQNQIEKQDFDKLFEFNKKYDIKFLIKAIIKHFKIDIKNIKLKIDIGTENVILTAFIIPIISTILSFTIKRDFEVNPIYKNKNIIKLQLDGIFDIKMIHIINTICTIKKKRRVYKNERTSNRRSYDNCYE